MFSKNNKVTSNSSAYLSQIKGAGSMLAALPEKQGRIAVALIVAVIILFTTLALPAWLFSVLIVALAVMMVREVGQMFQGRLQGVPVLLIMASALCLAYIRSEDTVGHLLIIYLACVLSACDTGAYTVGKAIGKRPLAAHISPHKTVEGAIGGVVLASLVSALLFALADMSLVLGVVLGATLAASGIVGDLYESHLKRQAGVKDSGTALLHHGGLLDRYDSYLFAAPLLAFPLFILSLL